VDDLVNDDVVDHLLSHSFHGHDMATLRRLVSRQAAVAGLADRRCQDFVLAVDEIVSNAVRHGGGGGRLTLWVADGRLWFQVADRGPGMAASPAAQPPEPSQLGGRGLWITRQVTDALETVTGPDGTVVTGAITLP
jgi:anti-sigma regulatory factor (Ser/Thr protein kinase)